MADIDDRVDLATITTVALSTTNATLLSANSNRKAAIFYNDSSKNAYVKFGATASTTSFTIVLTSGSSYELPLPIYVGRIDVILSSGSGNMQVTEIE